MECLVIPESHNYQSLTHKFFRVRVAKESNN